MSLIPHKKFDSFESLPEWAREAIVRYCNNDGATWVVKGIPALENRSFLDVMNGDDGEMKARKYFGEVIDRFFPGEQWPARR